MKRISAINIVGKCIKFFPTFVFILFPFMNIYSQNSSVPEDYPALKTLLEADTLLREYSMNPWKYDARNLPLDSPFPDDTAEWSGDMFRQRIIELTDSALSRPDNLPDSDIESIAGLISNYEDAVKIDLTVRDFMVFKGATILKRFAGNEAPTVIPFYPDSGDWYNSPEQRSKRKVESFYKFLIESNLSKNSIICALAMKDYAGMMEDEKRQPYLEECLKELSGSEGEGWLLYDLWQRHASSQSKILYLKIKDYLERYPGSLIVPSLKYAMNNICQERIEVSMPNVWLPATSFKANVSLTNVCKGYVLLYKLKAGEFNEYDNLILKKFNPRAVPAHVLEIQNDSVVPFSYEKEIELPPLEEGLYVAIPSLTSRLSKPQNLDNNGYYPTVRISGISILTSFNGSEKDSGRIYVVDSRDQKPVKGALVRYFRGNSNKPLGRLVTNEEGYVDVPEGYYRLEASLGNSVARGEAGFSYYPQHPVTSVNASVLTDLSVYRPGDNVRFAVMVWQQEKYENRLVRNRKIIVSFKDANQTKIKTLELTTDENGRTDGSFEVPDGKLMGTYVLTVSLPEKPDVSIGSGYVEVAEYKTPGFLVRLEQQQDSLPGVMTFKGIAETYSGVPIPDSPVKIEVEYLPWFLWRRNTNKAYYYETTSTDHDGSFSISLPVKNLENTPFRIGRFRIVAEVTSPSGENIQSKPLMFYLGNDYSIRPSINDKTLISGDTLTLHVPVYDIADLPVNAEVNYRFTNLNDSTLQYSGKFTSPSLCMKTSDVKPGRYRLEFRIGDLGEWTSTETIFWSKEDKRAPYPTSLWVPENRYVYETSQGSVDISFGSYWNNWILCVVSDETGILQRRWIEPSEALTVLKVDLPDPKKTYFVNLAGMHDLMGENTTITIVPKKSLEKMQVEVESFRSDISAGSKEVWKFRFMVDSIVCPEVSAFAVMTDKAINAIRDFKWNLSVWKWQPYSRVHLGVRSFWRNMTYRTFTTISKYPKSIQLIPDWKRFETDGIINEGIVMYESANALTRSARNMKSAASASLMMDSDISFMKSAVTEESVEEEVAAGENVQENEEIRPMEMPVAFFMPDLKSDEDGNLSVEFTVPDFNTTWQFQLAGYNENLLTSNLLLDAVASKQVMAKSNLPLYLRTGDLAEVSGLLFNNSPEALDIAGRIVVVNSSTGETLSEKYFDAIKVDPSANRLVSLKFSVPDNLNEIAVRTYAYSGECSDGEQGFIRIYPSSTPIIEALTFYASSGQETVEVALSKYRKNSNVTLKYCDNPLWEVLLALPALRENQNGSSLSVAQSLYAVSLANDIISGHPALKARLQKILSSEDSTLTLSNLQKDGNLKSVALQATPWVNDAASETDRIRSLEAYMDEENVKGVIERLTISLKKLQSSDGSWRWFEGMTSSSYITSRIISVLGNLNQTVPLSGDLKVMARRAVKYYDKWLVEQKDKKRPLPTVAVMGYLFARYQLQIPMTSEMRNIEEETKQKAAKEGLRWYVGEKTKEPLDPEKMFLQKETENWGNDIGSIGIIHALVTSVPQNVEERAVPEIMLDGLKLDIPETQLLTGSFIIDLPSSASGGKLLIKRDGGIPAWGGVITQYLRPIRDVKAAGVENLSVEKHLYIETPQGKTKEVYKLHKGDNVKVVLNLVCSKDMDYVALIDRRSACLQPKDQLSGMVNTDGLWSYREVRDNATSFFIQHLPAGKYVISYDCSVEREGDYSLGITEVQSLYSPAQVAHSGGEILKIE